MKDICAVGGLAMMGVGCWWMYPPLAMLFVGGVLVIGAALAHLKGQRHDS